MLSDAVNCRDIDKTICASRETVFFFPSLYRLCSSVTLWKLLMYFYSFKRHGFWQRLQPKVWSVVAIWCLHTWTGFHQYQSLLKLHKNIGKNLNQQNRVSACRSILVNMPWKEYCVNCACSNKECLWHTRTFHTLPCLVT